MDLEFHQLDRRYEDLRLHRPDRERSLLGSLCEHGQQVPIVVVAQEDGTYLVIDGFKRLRCLERLSADVVQAKVWDLEQIDALLLDRSQRSSEGLSQLEQGWLLEALRCQGLSQEELALRLDKSVSWVSRRLALVNELPMEVQEQVRRGAIPAHAAMRHLVPIARRSREDCSRLAAAMAKADLSSRESGELCTAFTHSSVEVRERLLSDPRLFLRARAKRQQPAPRPEALEMLGDLEQMTLTTRRLCVRLPQAEISPSQLVALQQAAAELRTQLDAFEQEIQRAQRNATQHHPDAGREIDPPASDCPAAENLAQHGPGSDRLGQDEPASAPAAREGRALPRRDPGASRELPRQSRPCPRGAARPGGRDLLPGFDRLLSQARHRDPTQKSGWKVFLRAGPGNAT